MRIKKVKKQNKTKQKQQRTLSAFIAFPAYGQTMVFALQKQVFPEHNLRIS